MKHRTNRSRWLQGALTGLFFVWLVCVFAVPSAPAQISQYLPFNMPSTASLRASPKKVFCHYFSPFPISIGNLDPSVDYYTTGYLAPDGEGGIHLSYGGYLRERPLPESVIPGDYITTNNETDVSRAIAIGLDGFTVDLLGGNGSSNAVATLFNAAHAVDTNFALVLMPDMTSIPDSNTLTAFVAHWAAQPSCYHLADGRLVVAPYYAEAQSVAWWKGWLATMSNSFGIKIAFVPLFQGWQNYAAAFAPISYGYSDWGDRDAVDNLSPGWTNAAALAHTYVPVWMHPVAPQDERPKDKNYTEAQNSANYRYTWELGAIGKADWVQIITWNDYSECSDISPSTGIQYSFYDLAAFYTCWFKTGTPPPIVRDCIYYFHRQQNTGAIPTIQSSTNLFTAGGTPDNTIEAYVFLTADATLEIEINGVTTDYPVTAPRAIVDVPLQEGQPIFRLIRNSQTVASVQTPFPISNTIPYQDMLYHGGSSLRQTVPEVSQGYWPRNIPAPPSSAPTGLKATAASGSQINLSWTATSGATYYDLARATVIGGPYEIIATGVATTNYSDTGLTSGTTYFYEVAAVNSGVSGPFSLETWATPLTASISGFQSSGTTVTLIINSLVGATYILQSTPTLINPVWTPILTNRATGDFLTNSVPMNSTNQFFRYYCQVGS